MNDRAKSALASLSRLFQLGRRTRGPQKQRKVRGRGIEFGAHRPYSEGDDLRHIVWAAYARSRRLVVREFEDTPEPRVVIIVDTTPSMAAGEPPVFSFAQRLAAGLGALAMGRGAGARLMSWNGKLSGVHRSEAQLGRLLGHAAGLEPNEVGARLPVDRLCAWPRSHLLLISDGLDPSILRALGELRRRHAVALHLIAPNAELPEALWARSGEARLELWDAELSAHVERVIDRDFAAEMAQRRDRELVTLTGRLDARSVPWARLSTGFDPEQSILRLVKGELGCSALYRRDGFI